MDNEEIKKLRDRIKEKKPIIEYNKNEINYLIKPIGKSIYLTETETPKDNNEKKLPNDKITCELCGGKYTRANSGHHKKTKLHQKLLKVNKTMMDFLINKN